MKDPFADIDQAPDLIQVAREYAKHPRGFLLLSGKNGTGKTYLAETIYAAFRVNDSDHKRFITQTDLNLKWQKDLREWNNTTHLLGMLLQTHLLVLDDLGTRVPTDAFMDFLYALIEKRHRAKDCTGTIITTNLNAALMRQNFGDAIVSRVASGQVFRLEGKDRRFKDF